MGEDIDGRADQYALAATAYHLLTGSTLFPQTNPAVVISRHLTAPPPNTSRHPPRARGLRPGACCSPREETLAIDSPAALISPLRSRRQHALAATRPPRPRPESAPFAGRPPESAAVPSARADADKQKRRRRRRDSSSSRRLIAVVTLAIIGVIGYMIQPKKHPPSTPAAPGPAPSTPA